MRRPSRGSRHAARLVACMRLVGLVLLAGSAGTAAAEPVTTIRANGPIENRVDVLILGDGFTQAQIDSGAYAAAVEAIVQSWFQDEPYKEYARYFNVHRLDLASQESGADHPSRGVFVATALDARYDCGGIQRLICIDVTRATAAIERSNVPPSARDLVLVIVNDPEYGGSGGSIAVASVHADTVELVRHETGHSFALLADEYGGPPPPSCVLVEPGAANATMALPPGPIKWAAWIAPGTPLPTTTTEDAVPGLYPGAAYCDTGMYRPTFNSKMRSLNRPFEQVNTEQHVRRIYNLVSPIDAFAPAAGAVTLDPDVPTPFSVSVPQPATHALAVEWRLDGTPVARGPAFTGQGLGDGPHTLEVTVRDPTPMVRSDPDNVLFQRQSWAVTVLASRPDARPTDLRVRAVAGNTVTVEWTPPRTGTATSYTLEGGATPGQTLAALPLSGGISRFTFVAPTGAFYIRLRATVNGVVTAASNETRLFVNVPAPPAAPVHLLGLAVGNALTLAWQQPTTGGAPAGHLVDVSGALSLSLPIAAAESFSFAGVPPGTYTFAVRAANVSGTTSPSNSVTLTFPGATCSVPDVPANVVARSSGRTASLAWDLPEAGAAPSGYVVFVAGSANAALAWPQRSIAGTLPPGSYTLRVAARNVCGTGPASAPQTLVVP